MAIKAVRSAVKYDCDAPDCRFSIIVEPPDVPDGFRGEVEAMTEASGPQGKKPWFACNATHIEPAIKAVLGHD